MSNLTKIQKLWIFSLFCILILEIKVWASTFSGVVIEGIILHKGQFWIMVGACVGLIIHYSITFYLGYVRKGTRWLLWCLLFPLPIAIVLDGYILFEDLQRDHLFLVISSGISFLGIIFYWLSCFALRRENLQRKNEIK